MLKKNPCPKHNKYENSKSMLHHAFAVESERKSSTYLNAKFCIACQTADVIEKKYPGKLGIVVISFM